MTPLIKSYKYVNPNLKSFPKLHRNGQTIFENAVSFSSKKSGNEIVADNNEPENKKKESETSSNEKKEYPEEPTTCCMSGCANCVWLDYAEKLNEYYKDGGEQAIKEINEKVTDENIKAFLLHELRIRNKK